MSQNNQNELDTKPVLRQITSPTDEEFHLIIDWMFNWWGIEEGYTREEIIACFKHGFNPTRLPQTFGLYDGEKLIGCCQFTLCDLEVRPDIYPWLANLYIDKDFRDKGFGQILIDEAIAFARTNTEFHELYLYTSHNGLYEKFGFEFISEIDTFRCTPRIQRLYRINW